MIEKKEREGYKLTKEKTKEWKKIIEKKERKDRHDGKK